MKRGPAWISPCVRALAFGIAGTLGGCGLAERAESLFMRQQSAQSSLATTVSEVETGQPQLAAWLYGLEDDLHAACRPLRRASLRRLEGQDLGSELEWAIVNSLEECESTTSTVEILVQQAKSGALRAGPQLDTSPPGFGGP